jgi:catechol 2,3-dioxygenase
MGVTNLGLDHVAIRVRDLERTIEFYTDVLGMAVSDRIEDDVAFVYPVDSAEDSEHHAMNITQMSDEELAELEERGDLEIDPWELKEEVTEIPPMLPARGPLYQIAFEVEDYRAIKEARDMLNERNHPIYAGPGRHGPGSNLFMYFPDPDGYTIELTADMEKAPESGGSPPKRWPAQPTTWNVWFDTDGIDE